MLILPASRSLKSAEPVSVANCRRSLQIARTTGDASFPVSRLQGLTSTDSNPGLCDYQYRVADALRPDNPDVTSSGLPNPSDKPIN